MNYENFERSYDRFATTESDYERFNALCDMILALSSRIFELERRIDDSTRRAPAITESTETSNA